ncbi:hypothetical protein [Aerococcus viridans]|uniref:hypothetical protein n=1 Tax=Aerococcus viridans TaxID=1377 RepID=UPI002DBB145D|nr:hypothetical protein [Aerococcus viridans]MEC1386517.1 hypothetical protein [Aerococcus viridans]
MAIELNSGTVTKRDLLYFLHEFRNLKRVLKYVAKSIEMANLTKDEKTLLYLFAIEGLSYEEIADLRNDSLENTRDTMTSIIRRTGIQMLVQNVR